MASVSEQIASRINFGSIAKADDLKKRILFTRFECLLNHLDLRFIREKVSSDHDLI